MGSLLGVGILVMIAADAIVGARLLRLAQRTRKLPEFSLGTAFILLGAVGYPLSIAARAGTEVASGLLLGAFAAQNAACFAVYVFTWKTFRPSERGFAVLVGAAAAALLSSLVGGALSPGSSDAGPWYYVGFAARGGAFGWATLESVRYYALLRRRLRLGLADPVVVDRIGLWVVATGSVSAGFLIFLFGRLTLESVVRSPFVLLSTSAVGLVAGVAIWLAFIPPAAYLRRVAARGRSTA